MKNLIFLTFLFSSIIGSAQHTFSIVAVDSATGEIGSAGATCGDSIIWPGTPGAKIISEIIPGIGAIHTQSYHVAANQVNAHNRMIAGDSPQQIIAWLIANDAQGDPGIRQYGIVDYNGGHPRSAGFTGAGCFDYKNHVLGKNYAIQGNILLGQKILNSMEARFLKTGGSLSDKLMAAMQGAKVVGADTRCTSNGTSSLSAFIRVARPTDSPGKLFLDLNIAGTAPGAEPIDKLQMAYTNWRKIFFIPDCFGPPDHRFYPNPTESFITVWVNNYKADKIEISGLMGQVLISHEITTESTRIDISGFQSGVYFINFYKSGVKTGTGKILKI